MLSGKYSLEREWQAGNSHAEMRRRGGFKMSENDITKDILDEDD